MDQQSHQGEVAEHGDEAVGEVEAHELVECGGGVAAVAPCVVEVPGEVVQERELDGRGRGVEVVAGEPAVEEGERGELDGHAHRAYEVELCPAEEGVHASGSSR